MNDALDLAVGDAMTGALSGSDVAASDIAGVIRRCLYTYTFDVLYLLDQPAGRFHAEPPQTDVGRDDPRWALMEVSPDGEMTGRDIGGLHESLIETDPTGLQAESWL